MSTPTITTKRVAGSAEVGFDANGQLVCTNFRAYRQRPKTEPPLGELGGLTDAKVYEYTEHYTVALRIPKDRIPGDRLYIERFAVALALIDAHERSRRQALAPNPKKKKK